MNVRKNCFNFRDRIGMFIDGDRVGEPSQRLLCSLEVNRSCFPDW
jgi:hypothetical protein